MRRNSRSGRGDESRVGRHGSVLSDSEVLDGFDVLVSVRVD